MMKRCAMALALASALMLVTAGTAFAANAGGGLKATGSVVSPSDEEVFAFAAMEGTNGKPDSGHFTVGSGEGALTFPVTCYYQPGGGNVAYFSGPLTLAGLMSLEGMKVTPQRVDGQSSWFLIRVEDNGEGQNAESPDTLKLGIFTGDEAPDCEEGESAFNGALVTVGFQLPGGNIQVHELKAPKP